LEVKLEHIVNFPFTFAQDGYFCSFTGCVAEQR